VPCPDRCDGARELTAAERNEVSAGVRSEMSARGNRWSRIASAVMGALSVA
jgi:hypothetical protein